MDKFVLAENPMRENSDLFICHLLEPIAIFQAYEGSLSIDGKICKQYQFRNSDGLIEEWTLSTHHFFTTDFINEPELQVPKIMDKAWRWYRSYMEWEDKNIDDGKY